jgi:hypothetical protein
MRLTQTQREVLEQASRHPHGRVSVHAWSQRNGRGFGRPDRTGGQRKLGAMKTLAAAGLLDAYDSHFHRGYARCGELPIYSVEATARITDAGRAAFSTHSK